MEAQKALSPAKSWWLGVTVVMLYVLFVTAVFSGFATYIYRSEWQSSLTGKPGLQDIDNLIFIVKREEMIEASLAAGRSEGRALVGQVAALETARDTAFGQLARIEAEREKQAFYDLVNFRGIDDALTEADQIALDTVLDDGSRSVTERADDALNIFVRASADLVSPDAERVAAVVNSSLAGRSRLSERHDQHTALALDAKAQLVGVQGTLAEIENRSATQTAQLNAFRELLPLGSEERARLDALSTSVPLVGNMFQRLVSFPTIFLTLIVTIAAGGLGTVVSFSRRYYAQQGQPEPARLFVNVGEGIAAAIAIFLFSGAGMLALTQGAGAGSGVELSPYTVAFVAFLSGFMAEDAFGSIQSAGRRIFKRDEDGNPPPEPAPVVPPPQVP